MRNAKYPLISGDMSIVAEQPGKSVRIISGLIKHEAIQCIFGIFCRTNGRNTDHI